MIQFLVLGQVPGTHFQITFNWFQVLLLASLVAAAYYTVYVRGLHNIKRMQQRFDAISLQNLDQA